MTTAKKVSIGDAVAQLQSEFSDVSVSKIRFLETEGLINPPRTKSGYREFGPADIERVRYILRQQRDHFLPLRVIKTKLAAWERGDDTSLSPLPGPPAEAYFATSGRKMTAAEAAQAAGSPEGIIADLVEHGVLNPMSADGSPAFDDDDVVIIRAAYRMIGHGLEPRHLRTIRLGSNREVDLFRQLAGPMLRHATPASRRQAGDVLADVAQAAREMQEAMIRADLRETLER